jgi:hypothetical protein
MDDQPLATLTAAPATLHSLIEKTVLHPDPAATPYFDDVFLRITDDGIDTPAGDLDTSPAVYTDFGPSFLDGLTVHTDGAVHALLHLATVHEWLTVFDAEETVTVDFYGIPDTGYTTRLVVKSGRHTVTFGKFPDEDVLTEVEVTLPAAFANGYFTIEGDPAPVVAETTVDDLQHVVDVADTIDYPAYPVHIGEDGPILDVEHDGVHAAVELDGETHAGGPVYNRYGDAFAAVVDTYDGPVRLETAANGPLAIVQDGDDYTLRVALAHE